MELKLNLFVHGVPKGQKIWGPKETDLNFIQNFYSGKSDVDVQLLVDIFETGGNLNTYYTYLKLRNILEKDGRQGSYFALTVRVNAYYVDLFNMYNILHATYQKFILDTIVNDSESVTRFIIDDFNLVDEKLQNIEKEIKKYLSSFSHDYDFIDLTSFASNAQSEPARVSLIECNNKNVFNHVKAKGNISVSPLYPPSQFAELAQKKEKELESFKLQMDQQITDGKKKSQQDIQKIKAEYASADIVINDLKTQLENEKKNSSTLKDDLKKANEKLMDYDTVKRKFGTQEKNFNEVNTILAGIKQLLNSVEGASIVIENDEKSRAHKNSSSGTPNLYLTFGIVVVTLLILLVVLYFIFHHPSG